ncbi:phage tail tape measure protein, partial [Acinetobacter baumannii]
MAGAAVAAPIKIAADREQHAIGIAKQLDGARDAAGNLTAKFWEMRKAVADLGHEIPLATNDLFDMATAGLRMGVAGDQILGFTRNVAKLASALELNPEEVADNMGKIQNVYRLTQAELVRLGDAINYLDDQNTVKGGELIDFL